MAEFNGTFDEYLEYMGLPENPRDIILNYTSIDGPTSVTFRDLDTHLKSIAIFGIVFGCRIGLAAVAFPTTYLMTKNKRSPVFFLNMTCLAVLFLQSCLFSVTLTKTYNSMSYMFSLYEINDRNAANIAIASNVLLVVLTGLIEISFCYQVYIIFESPQKRMKLLCYITTTFCAALGITTFVLYFIYMCYSNRFFFDETLIVPNYLTNTPLIMFASSSCVICFILLVKLAIAIRTRRHLGLTQFSLFHILFIMTFQTMIIPSILIFVSFNNTHTDPSSQTLSSLGYAFIAISLPLTTMWANSSVNNSESSLNSRVFRINTEPDNKSFTNSPTEYYPKTSLSDSEKQPENIDDMYSGEYDMNGIQSSAQDDRKFWKEVELYTKDLDKNIQNSSISGSIKNGIVSENSKDSLSNR